MTAPENHLGWRIVETQEIAATRAVTASAQAQSRLEELLDQTKPMVPLDCVGLDYRLFTPFRYPPLDYGSRFGSAIERGIFYGSTSLETAFAEASVYLWLFQAGMADLGPLKQMHAQRTAFQFALLTEQGAMLTELVTKDELKTLCAADSWQASQQKGTQFREQGLAYLIYPSARFEQGNNVAVFKPSAFASRVPIASMQWRLQMNNEYCWFSNGKTAYEYWHKDFSTDGIIPHPCL
ncbi:RES family NAD+ phosphorylase [Glaciecola sp. SC05]|uniref:RES family NAD+ phosphorylase n=1 Tax=Glaciecola sp. SC05 TaxID=1987355 RepID=UPI0035293756